MFVGTTCMIVGFSLYVLGCLEAFTIFTITGVILLTLGIIFYLSAKDQLDTRIERLEKELKEMKANEAI